MEIPDHLTVPATTANSPDADPGGGRPLTRFLLTAAIVLGAPPTEARPTPIDAATASRAPSSVGRGEERCRELPRVRPAPSRRGATEERCNPARPFTPRRAASWRGARRAPWHAGLPGPESALFLDEDDVDDAAFVIPGEDARDAEEEVP